MRSFSKGMTLIELVAVMIIVSTLLLWMIGPMSNMLSNRGPKAELSLAEIGSSSQLLIRDIRDYFSRARYYATTQSGAAVAGFRIQKNGAIVLRSDLRTFANFNPLNSDVNLTNIGILCCSPGLSVTANVPGGTTLVLNSACGNQWGLTIYTPNRSVCYPNIVTMNVFDLGPQDFANSQNALNIDFSADTVFTDGQPSGLKRLFFNVMASLGNTSNAPIVTCSKLGQFN